jgi:hypothetical protein
MTRKCSRRDCNGQWKLEFPFRSRNRTLEYNLAESKEARNTESENARIAIENDVGSIFYAEGIIHCELR